MGATDRDSAALARRYPSARMSFRRRRGFLSGFGYAVAGIRWVLETQPNFRFHLAVAVAVVALGVCLQLPAHSWAVLASTIGGVLVVEILNTAVEVFVDLVSPDDRELAKQAKDLAAAAVLLAALTSVVVGIAVLGPPLLARLR